MSNPPIRIMLVDDHKIVRESWKMLLENNPRFQVVAVTENGESAINDAEKLNPDIILIDVGIQFNGFSLTKKITKINPSIKIIGISINNQMIYARQMLELGAMGYITKTSPLEEINHGIIEVYNGNQYICNEIKGKTFPEKNGPL